MVVQENLLLRREHILYLTVCPRENGLGADSLGPTGQAGSGRSMKTVGSVGSRNPCVMEISERVESGYSCRREPVVPQCPIHMRTIRIPNVRKHWVIPSTSSRPSRPALVSHCKFRLNCQSA